MIRPDKDEYYLTIAAAVSLRGTCARRKVGCVLVDDNDRIMATGYNGVARGEVHCTDQPCPGIDYASGSGLDFCQAIHGEVNAIAYCSDVYKIKTCYCTTSPCVSCVKMLLGTSCQRIVFLDEYPHPTARALWLSARNILLGREWTRVYSPMAAVIRGPVVING